MRAITYVFMRRHFVLTRQAVSNPLSQLVNATPTGLGIARKSELLHTFVTDYFRALLGAVYSDELDEMLTQAFNFFEEVSGIPVLLSILILVFMHHRPGQKLPTDRQSLYESGMSCALSQMPGRVEDSMSMLRQLALANHVNKTRDFTSTDVWRVLKSQPKELALWEQLRSKEIRFPLLKTLAEDTAHAEGSFQFSHLSCVSCNTIRTLRSKLALCMHGQERRAPLHLDRGTDHPSTSALTSVGCAVRAQLPGGASCTSYGHFRRGEGLGRVL